MYYTNGTRKHWGKFKRGCKIEKVDTGLIDLDLVVMGVIKGSGKNSNYFATYLLGTYIDDKLYPVSKLGSGFTEDELSYFT